MTTVPAASSEDKPAVKETNDANEKVGESSSVDAAAKKRESFLRRIEQQQQQKQQQESAPKEASDESKVTNTPSSPQEKTDDLNANKKDDTTRTTEKKQQDDESTKSTEKKKKTGLEEIREIAKSSTDDQVMVLAQALAKALAESNATRKSSGNSNGTTPSSAGPSSSSSKPKSNITFNTQVPTNKKHSIGDQLLTDYLSKFCDGPNNHNDGACCPPSSSPADWIQDVDPSSLAVLKVMAGIKDATTSTTPNTNAGNTAVASSSSQLDASSTMAVGRTRSDMTAADKVNNPPPPGNNFNPGNYGNNQTFQRPPTTPAVDEPTKMWEVQVPPEAISGEPFTLMAGGVRVRVLCPKNAGPGQRIRFHLPTSLFTQTAGKAESAERPPPPPVPMPPPPREEYRRGPLGYGGNDSANVDTAAASGGPNNNAGDSNGNNNLGNDDDNDDPSRNRRMIAIIERQQTQMQEMQARLDALGGMMASMEQDVRYLRQQREQRGGRRDVPVGGYRMFGGLFGGNGGGGAGRGDPAGGGGGQQYGAGALQQGGGGLPQAERGRPELHAIPHIPPEIPRAVARPVPDNAVGQQHQGIFYPLFVIFFTFLFSLPGRLRNLLLHTGPGRVYAHLREQARVRRAFAHVDLASVVKLLVMLLIFAGRVGRDNGGGNNRRPNNNNGARNNNARDNGGGDDADASMIAHAWTLLRTVADYWNGHRVHTLVLASMIAFLIQVGLMSFLYQVLWVERAGLLRAFLGREDAEGDMGGGGAGGVEGGAPNGGDDAGGNARRRNPAQRPVGRPENAGNIVDGNAGAAGAAPPDVANGGMIRRGPNNGGFFHDIQCLAISFVLSLIPAWRPEEAAQPAEEVARRPDNAARAGQQEPPPAQLGGAGNDAGAAGDEIIVE